MKDERPKCRFEGKCFARYQRRCEILEDADFGKRWCPFMKPDRDYTDGKFYGVEKR